MRFKEFVECNNNRKAFHFKLVSLKVIKQYIFVCNLSIYFKVLRAGLFKGDN